MLQTCRRRSPLCILFGTEFTHEPQNISTLDSVTNRRSFSRTLLPCRRSRGIFNGIVRQDDGRFFQTDALGIERQPLLVIFFDIHDQILHQFLQLITKFDLRKSRVVLLALELFANPVAPKVTRAEAFLDKEARKLSGRAHEDPRDTRQHFHHGLAMIVILTVQPQGTNFLDGVRDGLYVGLEGLAEITGGHFGARRQDNDVTNAFKGLDDEWSHVLHATQVLASVREGAYGRMKELVVGLEGRGFCCLKGL
jgi:hypothetical protein